MKLRTKPNKNSQSGMTLVEMLIYMAILSTILLTITQLFFATLDVGLESAANSNVQQDGRYLLARMSYDIRRADVVTSPALGVSASELRFQADGQNYTYSMNVDALEFTEPSYSGRLNSSETALSELLFERIGNTIKINFKVTSLAQASSGVEEQVFSTTVRMK